MKIDRITRIGLLLFLIGISGCARNTYTMEGTTYRNPKLAVAHQNKLFAEALASVTPLKTPVTTKKLVIAIPSKSTAHSIVLAVNASTAPNASQQLIDFLVDTDMNNAKFIVDGIKKKNIYSSVEVVETGMNPTLAASSDADTMFFFSDPTRRTFQWFLANQKNGKQVLTFDASLPSLGERVESQLNGVKAFALQ